MTATSEKVKLLKEHGYRYNFRREIYVNAEVKKIFAQEVIEDNDIEWLTKSLTEENKSGDWCFYFNRDPNVDPPSDGVRAEIISELV